MEIIKASVEQLDDQYFIKIGSDDNAIKIPMSEDKPKEVKSAFNKLIVRMKGGVFQIEMDEAEDDLFSQVASEYIMQLNKEILGVHGEMVQYALVKETGEPSKERSRDEDTPDSL